MSDKRVEVSWSQIQSFNECQLQYTLRHIDHRYVGKDQYPFLVGSICHDLIHDWSKTKFAEGYIKRHVVPMFKKTAKARRVSLPIDKLQEVMRRTVVGALRAEKIVRSLKLPEHDALFEKRFSVRLACDPRYAIKGAFDIYDPETFTVYDWKFYSDERSKGKPDQLLTYAVACTMYGQRVDRIAFLYPLRRRMIESREISQEEIDAWERELARAAHAKATGKTTRVATQGPHCFFCEYRGRSMCSETHKASTVKEGKHGIKEVSFEEATERERGGERSQKSKGARQRDRRTGRKDRR